MMRNSLDLTDRVAVVIGASSGIGRAIALGFARHGAHVVPTARRAACVECVCREVLGLHRRTLMHLTDVTSRASIDALRDAVLAEFGGADILVNAAGFTVKQPTTDIAEEDWHNVMDTNVNGVLRASVAFHDALASSGRGRVINIASLGSFLAFHEVAAYCASKAAVASLTRNLACEWAKHGISVNAIAPGVFPTELNGEIISGTPRGEEILLRTPLGRFGDPAELVGAAVLLASDGASFLTGQTIAVDGGYLASGVNT
ncbi:MAG: glucose 1-dehydrogenase [Bryobacteraceae bacterium]|jgi:NAD(P)-dependent dehydrogenase (short-subunit alcohol dehydrogenase family)